MLDVGLAILLSSLASPLLGGLGGKNETKSWISPSMGVQDPYMLDSLYKRGLQYGIGDQAMFKDIQGMIGESWPSIMRYYGNKTGRGNKYLPQTSTG